MANLISTEMKTSAMNAMKDIFDSFKRATPISFYKEESKTVVMIDPNYNSTFGPPKSPKFNQNLSVKPQYQSFYMRVWYMPDQNVEYGLQGDQDLEAKYKQVWGKVKIQMEADAYEYFKGVERVKIEDQQYKIWSEIRKIGIFDTFQFYEALLERVS